jgi:hypothetical protein
VVLQEQLQKFLLMPPLDLVIILNRIRLISRPMRWSIRLDSPEDLVALKISFQPVVLKPVVLKSLLNAGFRCLGDLRWVSNRELRQLRYIGIKCAQQLRDILRRMEQRGT